MVLQRHAFGTPNMLRACGFAIAYAFAMATGTAVLIAALGTFADAPSIGSDGSTVTPAEVLIQQTSERTVLDAQLLASRHITNDQRGF